MLSLHCSTELAVEIGQVSRIPVPSFPGSPLCDGHSRSACDSLSSAWLCRKDGIGLVLGGERVFSLFHPVL